MNLSKLSLSMVRSVGRLAFSVLLLLALVSVVGAYTLVFRDGRRVEIPAQFTLTKTTLTYELAPGFNKTVQVILIDVAATERANHEAAGDFFKHVDQESTGAPPLSSQRALITLTNRDLESIQRRRLESEKNYENRRRELGLPSVEESRLRQQQEETALLDRAREQTLLQARDEAYWRERATTLRTEIAAVDAEINYLRSRLSDTYQTPLATPGFVISAAPYGYGQFGTRTAPSLHSTGAGVVGNSTIGSQFPAPGVYGGWQNRGPFPMNQRSRRYRTARPYGGYGYPNGYPYGYPPGSLPPFTTARPYDLGDSYEQSSLTERLDSLLTTRAGLSARWLQLEDEARDARVPQIWLEP